MSMSFHARRCGGRYPRFCLVRLGQPFANPSFLPSFKGLGRYMREFRLRRAQRVAGTSPAAQKLDSVGFGSIAASKSVASKQGSAGIWLIYA